MTGSTGGPPPAVCEAVRTGSFHERSTWRNGFVPSGSCDVVIPAGINVTFTGGVLNTSIPTLTIGGRFIVVSTGSIGFTFVYTINILVLTGGFLEDQTDNNLFYCRPDTVFTFLPSAAFIGISTQVYIYTGSDPSTSLGASFTFDWSVVGPYTFGILVNGTILNFYSVMCIVRGSGSFTDGFTWLGGVAPTVDFCASAGGCDLYVPAGFSLFTASLNGQLNIRFNVITVAVGGTLYLGTTGVGGGFRFFYTITLEFFGDLQYVSGDNAGIFLPFGSVVNFYTGAIFYTTFTITIYYYNYPNFTTVGSVIILTNGYSVAFYYLITISGTLQINTGRK